MASGLVLAAPTSGSGKTVLCAALLAHFRERGLAVRAFKAGPDYIDPGYHRMATGHDCVNLDPWGMRPETLAHRVSALSAGADLVIGEGAMGLFDGARDGTGSTADLAARLGLPVLLVVDARGQGASVAALAEGFAGHRPDVTVAGVILNRVAGAAHEGLLRDALEARSVPVLGAVPRDEALSLPSRHLGLVQACESDVSWAEDAAAIVARSVDIDTLASLARPLQIASGTAPGAAIPPLGQRIAVARDAAFGFCYDALMEDWRAAGAAVVPFSPLADKAPEPDADAIYLPGGYPELHAVRIADAARFLDGLRAAAARGVAVFGECGGYMVLGRGLTDADGRRHAMAGLLPLETSFQGRRLSLGYRHARLAADGPLGKAGARFRGHEFHYCRVVSEEAEQPLFSTQDATGQQLGHAGMSVGTVSGSFIHLIDRA
ncbi:MAG: cobyrinate a,c-diamide synthase [Rhodospirillales bacterium]|nr:cobyrinate a,c-diamide synthase [Rhodospirillales bacterium]